MQREQLWAPWRLAYLKGDAPKSEPTPIDKLTFLPGADTGCFLCRAMADNADRANLVVQRGQRTFAILNRYPYANGHVLVAPNEHHGKLGELDPADHTEAMATITRLTVAMERLLNAEGFNVGLNLGRVAGAGVPGHLHWHVVPRWNGDTNFMPVLGDVHVISQSLDALWDLLTPALANHE